MLEKSAIIVYFLKACEVPLGTGQSELASG